MNLCRINEFLKNDAISAEEISLCININRVFSSPSSAGDKDYIVSQYITEYIKTLAYKGIVFNSSRNKGGENITLFNDYACEWITSEIYAVTETKVKSQQILPLAFDE